MSQLVPLQVNIYSSVNQTLKKSITRFRNTAYCGTYRRDGKLLVSGGEDSVVQLFDMGSRTLLRSFKGHRGAVHVAKFSPLNTVNVALSPLILTCPLA